MQANRNFDLSRVIFDCDQSRENYLKALSGEKVNDILPAVVVTGSRPGCGKSLLVDDMIRHLGLEQRFSCTKSIWPLSEKRMQRMLTACGDRLDYIWFDDVAGFMPLDVLSVYLTSKRIYAVFKEQVREIETKARIFISGNNLTLPEDFLRRALVIGLCGDVASLERSGR